jgi:sigma-E factor negative regulatory protein RseA
MADKTAELASAPPAHDVPIAASQLSALVDDELADMEIALVLRRLSRDGDARDRWERYHLISDVIQGHHVPAALDTDFAARVRQAIEAEPLLQAVARPLPAWYKPVTGFGLAASVALMALYGLKLATTTPVLSSPYGSLPIQMAAMTQPANPIGEPVEARLNSYLVNHNGYASMSSVNGMLPYVRMVGYQQPSR